jgi:hypothetical protein
MQGHQIQSLKVHAARRNTSYLVLTALFTKLSRYQGRVGARTLQKAHIRLLAKNSTPETA